MPEQSPDRAVELAGARLLVRGRDWPVYGPPALALGILAVLLQQDTIARDELLLATGIITTVAASTSWLMWTLHAGFALWDSGEALVARRRPGRWVRIPWSEVRGVTWVRSGDLQGPAVTTTGGPYDRPNPSWMTLLGKPLLVVGGRGAAIATLRSAVERHGVPWRDDVPDEQVENNWTSTRWTW